MKIIEDLTDEQIVDALLRIAPHARIAHHIPGRIRFKVSPEGAKALNGRINIGEPARIPGILSSRVNAFARSMIIKYDQEKIPYDLWERLGRIKEKPEDAKELVHELRALLLNE